jgi:hypothetical protein
MRPTLLPPFLGALLLWSCGPKADAPPAVPPPADSTWAGELQVTGPDIRFMACGTGIRYAVTGPGTDTTLRLYNSQRSVTGQTMKAWLTGHLAEQHPGARDTAFVVARIEHIDATLTCPPRPKPMLAGRYELVLDEAQGRRTLVTELFPNGEVLNTTWLPGKALPFEMDGTWGVNGAGEVEIHWPMFDKRATYGVTENTLTLRSPAPAKGSPAFSMRRTGPPQRMGGTFGAVVRWMHAVCAAQGLPLDSTRITVATPLGDIVTSTAVRDAMTDSAITWFPLNADMQRVQWPAMSTVGDMVALKRTCDRMAK